MAASALQSFVSQLWTSQALVAECSDIERHKLFGVYGGVISSRCEVASKLEAIATRNEKEKEERSIQRKSISLLTNCFLRLKALFVPKVDERHPRLQDLEQVLGLESRKAFFCEEIRKTHIIYIDLKTEITRKINNTKTGQTPLLTVARLAGR